METSSRCIVNININIRSNNSALVAPSSSNINIRSDSALIAPSSIATVFHMLWLLPLAPTVFLGLDPPQPQPPPLVSSSSPFSSSHLSHVDLHRMLNSRAISLITVLLSSVKTTVSCSRFSSKKLRHLLHQLLISCWRFSPTKPFVISLMNCRHFWYTAGNRGASYNITIMMAIAPSESPVLSGWATRVWKALVIRW